MICMDKYRDLCTMYLIWLVFGIIGGHRYALGDWRTGLLWTFTAGLFGLGYVYWS